MSDFQVVTKKGETIGNLSLNEAKLYPDAITIYMDHGTYKFELYEKIDGFWISKDSKAINS
jgi:hypothetical protein